MLRLKMKKLYEWDESTKYPTRKELRAQLDADGLKKREWVFPCKASRTSKSNFDTFAQEIRRGEIRKICEENEKSIEIPLTQYWHLNMPKTVLVTKTNNVDLMLQYDWRVATDDFNVQTFHPWEKNPKLPYLTKFCTTLITGAKFMPNH